MAEKGSQAMVKRYFMALAPPQDVETLAELRHPDFVEEWPQSDERIRGHENSVQIHKEYPANVDQEFRSIAGSEDSWTFTPMFSAVQIAGTGDVYTVEARARYPDDKFWHIVSIIKLRNGKIHRATTYFAPEFEPPESRAQWVERISSS
jgi:ketosteroid isomerase-like protein